MATVPVETPARRARDVAARGARIRFVEAGSGPPLVLVHDYLSSHVAWDGVVEQLAQTFRVIVPDLPGFGESEKPPPARYPYGFAAFSESLVDLLAALDLSRASICGHAMGGAVALTIAAKHPHVVDKLVLVTPLVYPPRPDLLSQVAGIPVLGAVVFKQLYGRSMFRSYVRTRDYASGSSVPWERIDRLFDQFNLPAAREAAYATMVAISDTRPLMASIPRVTAPTLVVCGRNDRACPVDHGRRLARELRGARFEVFECGHSPPEECPEPFVSAMTAFLQGGRGG